MSQFSTISNTMNKKLSKKERKDNGIFFTPKDARKKIFDYLENNFSNQRAKLNILEPSFGSGEFLEDLYEKYPNSRIHGIEKNVKLYTKVKETITFGADSKAGIGDNTLGVGAVGDSFLISPSMPTAKLVNQDFLEYKSETTFDLIIGNPPYFVTKIKEPKCMTGRGNIFVLFLYKCLTEHLKTNGVLAFVLPTSLYNCSYYAPCRNYIAKNTTILHVEDYNDIKYCDTSQKTMFLILQKEKPKSSATRRSEGDDNFLFKIGKHLYINPNYKELREIVTGSSTFKELGFDIKTGVITWNEYKKNLCSSPSDGVLLIYSSNIIKNKLVINNLKGNEKKQYIKDVDKTPNKGPAILIPRGYGNSYKFQYLIIEEGFEFYAENHINVISSITFGADSKAGICNASITFDKIKESMDSDKTKEFIKLFVGNGALSKTELHTVFPVYIN